MKQSNTLNWLHNRISKRRPMLALLVFSNVATAVLGVLFAIGTKRIVNSAVAGLSKALLRAAGLQLLVIVGVVLFHALHRYLQSRLVAELDRDWKKNLLHKILFGDYAKVTQMHSGEYINRLNNDVRAVNDGLVSVLPGLASMVTRLLGAIIVLSAMTPLLTVILLGIGLFSALAAALARKFLRELNKRISESDGKVLSFLQETFEKLLLVQGMSVEREVERRSDSLLDERYNLQKKRWKLLLLSNTGINLIGYICGFVALVYCAFGIYRGRMDFGELTAVTYLVSQLHAPLVHLSGLFPKYAAMLAGTERLMEVETLCRHQGVEQTDAVVDSFTAIEAENLSFSYDREVIFEDATFAIPAESFTVVTGQSGIGKSTLLKLALGIFYPDCGELRLRTENGSVAISRSTRALFAYVPQGNLLFSGTLRENLLLGKPDATEEELQQAIYVSCMDAYIPSLPNGLDTLLGENAHGLSEGQAQRLSIARAVLADAPILLLDECTSALDEDTEFAVLRRIRELEGKTCIVVSHRPAAATLADCQMVIEAGKVHMTECNKESRE